MLKSEVEKLVAKKAGVTMKTVGYVLEAISSVLQEKLHGDAEITLPGIGKFKAKHREAREGRNPGTGESLHIPAKNVVVFVAAKALKDAVAFTN